MTSMIGLLVAGLWWQSSQTYDIVVSRENYYQKFYSAEVVLSYGISIVKKYFDNFLSKTKETHKPILLDMSFLAKELSSGHNNYTSATLTVKKSVEKLREENKKQSLHLVATILDNYKNSFSLQCFVTRYNFHENRKKGHKKENLRFVVECYTLGTCV